MRPLLPRARLLASLIAGLLSGCGPLPREERLSPAQLQAAQAEFAQKKQELETAQREGQDLGYRFEATRKRCLHPDGRSGYNPGRLGECGLIYQSPAPGASLAGANLQGIVILPGLSLASANLKGANLSYAHLGGVDLSGASLEDARWTQADLSGAILCGAKGDPAKLVTQLKDAANARGARADGPIREALEHDDPDLARLAALEACPTGT